VPEVRRVIYNFILPLEFSRNENLPLIDVPLPWSAPASGDGNVFCFA